MTKELNIFMVNKKVNINKFIKKLPYIMNNLMYNRNILKINK